MLGQDLKLLILTDSDESVIVDTLKFQSSQKLDAYLDSISSVYQRQGYLSAYWDNENKGDSIFAQLNLGPRIERLQVRSNKIPASYLSDEERMPSTYAEYLDMLDIVLQKVENEGFPFAGVSLGNPLRKDGTLEADLIFDSGPLITWDSVKVLGSSKTKDKYLQNLSFLKPGEPFSQEDFRKAALAVSRSPYFSIQNEPEISFQQQKAQPQFTLVDRRANVIDGIIGILPNENEEGSVLITGQLDLELYHLGGKGRDIALHWQRLNVETQSLSLLYKESYLFGSRISALVDFSLLKQDTTFLNRDFGLSFLYEPNPKLFLSFFTRRQASDLISTFGLSEVTELPEVADFRWNQYGLDLVWQDLDSPIFPRKGWRLQGKFSVGNKRILENTAIPSEIYADLDLSTTQFSIWGSIEKHISIKPIWGMWVHSSFGLIDNENLLLNDLFRIGGLKSIRGFNENFFYARSFAYLNFEQRLFLGEGSYLLAFVDGGFVEDPYADETRDYPFSLGAGLNLATGSGMFKFILGVGSANEQPFSFSYSRIHFGYVANF